MKRSPLPRTRTSLKLPLKHSVSMLLLVLAVTLACGSGQFLVRVDNQRSTAISVQIGPADYGSVAPQTITDYKEVKLQDNRVLVDGVETPSSPVGFGEGLTGTHQWTYFFTEGGGEGFVSDDFGLTALGPKQR
jgi:hypothetical protein